MSTAKEHLLRSEAELELDLVSTTCFKMLRGPQLRLTSGLHTGKEAKSREIQGCRRSHIPPRRAVRYEDTRGLRLGFRERARRS
jgi:hypothetical protein